MPCQSANFSKNKFYWLITGASLGLKNMYTYIMLDKKMYSKMPFRRSGFICEHLWTIISII